MVPGRGSHIIHLNANKCFSNVRSGLKTVSLLRYFHIPPPSNVVCIHGFLNLFFYEKYKGKLQPRSNPYSNLMGA